MDESLSSILSKILKFINIIGILSILFGIPNSYTLLSIVYGSKWNSQVK